MEVLLTGTHFTCLYDGSYNPLPEFIGSDCSFCTPADYKIIQQALPSGIISEIFVASDEDTTYTLVADESHYSAPGNESFLYILSFVDPLLETAVNVDVELVSHSGWTAPTNTNHPLSVQNHNYGGGSTVVLGLGNVPTVPLSILASQGVVFHSKTQFTVTFRLTPHI
jgi:hypothetical protein